MRGIVVLRETEVPADFPETHHHIHHHTHHHHATGEEAAYVAPSVNPVMAAISERLANPPPTWMGYAGRPDAIIEMEFRELSAARETGSTEQVRKELLDLAAACALALEGA